MEQAALAAVEVTTPVVPEAQQLAILAMVLEAAGVQATGVQEVMEALLIMVQGEREEIATTLVATGEMYKTRTTMGMLVILPAAVVVVQEVFRVLRIEQEVKELQVR